MALHDTLSDGQHHPAGYFQATDPGAVGPGVYWVDSTGGSPPYPLKIRNVGNTAWEAVGSTGGAGLLVWAASAIDNSQTVASTTTETDYNNTVSLPANTLAVGDTVLFRATGAVRGTATGSLTVRFYIGSTVFQGAILYQDDTSGVDLHWIVEGGFVVRTIGASGSMFPETGINSLYGNSEDDTNRMNPGTTQLPVAFTVDTTAAQTLKVSGKQNVSSANDSSTMYTFRVEVHRATVTM